MKKTLALILAICILASLAGCGLRKKVEEKAAEALAENLLGGNGSKVDIDGDQMTIQGDDGESVTFGSTDWPSSDLMKHVPEFKKGEITSVMESGEYTIILLESVSLEDAEDYIEKIKKDFTANPFSMNAEDFVSYSGENDGVAAAVQYSEGSVTITVTATATEQ